MRCSLSDEQTVTLRVGPVLIRSRRPGKLVQLELDRSLGVRCAGR